MSGGPARAADALAAAVRRLDDAGVPDPARDGRRLLAHALGLDPARLGLVLREPVDPDAAARFDALIAGRAARMPLSHLTGTRAFWGRSFIVSPAVLDPRPETEALVDHALRAPFARVLDLGTGSGCILLTLLAERPHAQGLGTDRASDALSVARRNAAALGVSERLTLREGCWFDAVPAGARYDLIVSNPPYIPRADLAGLSPEVRDHEPRGALTDEADGLSAYRAIAAGAPAHLAEGGRLLLEIGPTQGAAVAAMLRAAGLSTVTVLPDLDGRDRVVAGVFG